MKKVVWILLVIALLVVAACTVLYFGKPAAKEEPVPTGEITEIPVDTVRGITQQEAEALCFGVLGEKDEETGFVYSFGVAGAVEQNGKQYYVVRISWLVNGDHLSYIGDFFVSADGNTIYNGAATPEGYTMTERIWKK